MKNKFNRFKNQLRIVLAITRKDILDGWQNKVILTSVFTILILILFYHYMPNLIRADELPKLVVLDQTGSAIQDELVINPFFELIPASTAAEYENLLRDLDLPGLGITLPENALSSGTTNPLSLSADIPYWMTSEQANTVARLVETELSSALNKPITIELDGNIIYPLMESFAYGKTFIGMASLLIGLILIGLSMAPQLIVEEKDDKTLDALMVSPVSYNLFILGKGLAVVFYCVLTTSIALIFVNDLVLNWGLMIAALLIGMLAVVTPGMLLGVLIPTKQQITIWIWVIFIPTLLPLFFSIVRILPETIMKIVDWWPTNVLSRLLLAGMTYQPPLDQFGINAIYMLGLSAVFFGLSIWAIRRQTA